MSTTNYPYTAWVLLPSMNPKEVTIVSAAYEHSYPEWEKSQSGKLYHKDQLFASKALAVDAGWTKLALREEAMRKQGHIIHKQRANLTKASKP